MLAKKQRILLCHSNLLFNPADCGLYLYIHNVFG